MCSAQTCLFDPCVRVRCSIVVRLLLFLSGQIHVTIHSILCRLSTYHHLLESLLELSTNGIVFPLDKPYEPAIDLGECFEYSRRSKERVSYVVPNSSRKLQGLIKLKELYLEYP